MNEALISVVVPNYNNAQYLPECIDSLKKQSHKNIEIIIVDDESTDNSEDVIDKMVRDDPRIKSIFNERNVGISRNRHKGIISSSGKYITTLDADDYLIDVNKLKKECEIMDKCVSEDVIAFSRSSLVHGNGKLMKEQDVREVSEGDLFLCIFARTCVIPRDYMFTKKQYTNAGGFNPELKMYEDWDLKIRMARKNKFYYTGLTGVAYRRHGQGLSSVNRPAHYKWLKRVYDLNRRLYRDDMIQSVKVDFDKFINDNFTVKDKIRSLFV